jgi:plasmid stabilization system protein ParE
VKLKWSARSDADLAEIGRYIAVDDPVAARRWVDKIVAKAIAASKTPGIGRMAREYARPEVREVNLRSYRIIYVVRRRHILVLTVLEGHRQPPPLELLLVPEP